MADNNVIRIKPLFYIHVLNNNSNVTRLEIGPQTFTKKEEEVVVFGPEPMLLIPPRHYCEIKNPVFRNPDGTAVRDERGQVKLRHEHTELRFEQDPFPLHPGEQLIGKVTPLKIVEANCALKLKAIRDFQDGQTKFRAGDEWLFKGPATYIPRVEVQVLQYVTSTIIRENQALKLRALRDCVDSRGNKRQTGEEWLVRDAGAYLPTVNEEIVSTVDAQVLTEKVALHLQATNTFKDIFGEQRKAGQEWLVTFSNTESYIADVYERVVGLVKITTLSSNQYCIVSNPHGSNGKPKAGQRELRLGELRFFLKPGESIEGGIKEAYVLGEEEALLLFCNQDFKDDKGDLHKAGQRWMIYGPTNYIPPLEVSVIERRKSIPLDANEGVYVRDITTGKVRSVIGQAYMLLPNEELWKKELPALVESLLDKSTRDKNDQDDQLGGSRDKTKVVTYRVTHGASVQIYDFKQKKARVVFGPELVMLGPDEEFTVLNLSGDVPKKEKVIKSLQLFLGPDFMNDEVVVETSDHARLALKMSYNWQFQVDITKPKEVEKLFSVPDFVGEVCKALASMVRSVVAGTSFDEFHKSSSEIIQKAVFGKDDTGKPNNMLFFPANHLCITNVDVQSVEPVDQRTRESLMKSVQMAIDITIKSQEDSAKFEALRTEQEAKGKLERQKIHDKAQAEKARKALIELQTQSLIVESTGRAIAEAKARTEAQSIEAHSQVDQARLSAAAAEIAAKADYDRDVQEQQAELEHRKALAELELTKAKDLAAIEAKKFKEIVNAIGSKTITSMARSGPEQRIALLKGLGLQNVMITDGNSPINLFQTANGITPQQN